MTNIKEILIERGEGLLDDKGVDASVAETIAFEIMHSLRLLDVPVGMKQWDPANAERLRLLRKEIAKPAADSGTKKGKE